MRVVAGSVGGRVIEAPPGRRTRPTSDRVREAIFSSLASLGGIDGVAVADLFAGSGALGIEALSRGAASAVFVEHDPRAAGVVAANLRGLGLDAVATVRRSDAVGAAGTPEVAAAAVVFADPPYAFDGWPGLCVALAGAGFGGLLVAETGRALAVPSGWDVVRVKTYGSTVVTMLRPSRPAGGVTP